MQMMNSMMVDDLGFGGRAGGFMDDFFDVGGQRRRSHGGGGGGAVMHSVSTVTEIRNGQRVTKTVRRTQNGDGVVTEDVDEEVAMLRGRHHHHQPLPPLPAAGPTRGGGGQQQSRDAMRSSYSYY